ncbi:MAG: hypothetical protein U0835_22015 [Isosphaeraceae bacterium]
MATVLRVDDLIHDTPLSGTGELSEDPAELARFWCMVLLMAVRDHASSVHYHPWRDDGGLAYIVGENRLVLEPPPYRLAGPLLAVARSLLTGTGWVGSPSRHGWFEGAGAVCSSVVLDIHGDRFPWDAVLWSSGERSGVELFRAAPP